MDLSYFTISGDIDQANNNKLQNERLIRLRWYVFIALTLTASIASAWSGDINRAIRYLFICGAGVLVNAIFYIVCKKLPKKSTYYSTLMITQILFDISVASYVTYFTGGPFSRSTAIFAIPIVSSGLIFSNAIVYITAVLSGIAYVFSLTIYAVNNTGRWATEDLLFPIIFYPIFYIILARLVAYLMQKATTDTQENAYDAFLALLSHQLKHPVSTANAIIDQINYVESKSQSSKELKKYIQFLKNENQDLLFLLNNLIETAKKDDDEVTKSSVDLPKIIQEIGHYTAERHNRTTDLKLRLKNMNLMVVGNSERLKTCLYNVLENAFVYSEQKQPVSVLLKVAGDNAIIEITDKGVGFKNKPVKNGHKKYNISQPGSSGVKGLGLGLYVAEKIIKAHKGSIHIKNDTVGTKVLITLKRSINEKNTTN